MPEARFDALARALGRTQSRRQLLQVLAGSAVGGLGALVWRRGGALAAPPAPGSGGNASCAQFCASVFGETRSAGQCTAAAAQHQGLCFSCGPAAAAGHPDLCGTSCCPAGTPRCLSGQCVRCLASSDCPPAAPICTASHTCCTPRTCQAGQCGSISDGCGGTLNCGSCNTSQCLTCSSNMCVSTCGATTPICNGSGGCLCTADSCSGDQICLNGSCQSCGMPTQPCCPGNSCNSEFGICVNGTCQSCGFPGDPCCPDNSCIAGAAICISGTCQTCGNEGQPCCAGNSCFDANAVCQSGTCQSA